MALRKFKIVTGLLFMFIFLTKTGIGMAPAFLNFSDKDSNSFAAQAEPDGKAGEKDIKDKGGDKDKLPEFDHDMPRSCVYSPLLAAADFNYRRRPQLYQQSHHPAIPTPPPDLV